MQLWHLWINRFVQYHYAIIQRDESYAELSAWPSLHKMCEISQHNLCSDVSREPAITQQNRWIKAGVETRIIQHGMILSGSSDWMTHRGLGSLWSNQWIHEMINSHFCFPRTQNTVKCCLVELFLNIRKSLTFEPHTGSTRLLSSGNEGSANASFHPDLSCTSGKLIRRSSGHKFASLTLRPPLPLKMA